MKVVIQCARSKQASAGTFSLDSQRVSFVSKPRLAPGSPGVAHFHPDELIPGRSITWREHLVQYNRNRENPQRLLPAADLYSPDIYRELRDHVGVSNFYILSAGWGLVRADYLLPLYDITFSIQAKPCKRRGPRDRFKDFNHLREGPLAVDEPIYFFGGRDYLSLYHGLVAHLSARKIVYYVSSRITQEPSFAYVRYPHSGTNWHYRCARDFIRGVIPS